MNTGDCFAGQQPLVGQSPAIRHVHQMIERVASSGSTVLIQGESGTGKELVARSLHNKSERAGKPFAAIDCAAISESLLQSELFGHEKGAFTGAICQKKGKLHAADGGTVFLDEISEIAPSVQAKLLRVIQERELERVGGNETIKVDIRILAATNRNLEEAVQQGVFRQDLFFRLNVVSIHLPALRERKGDIGILAEHFAEKFSRKAHRAVKGLCPLAQQYLIAYDWPGNVRELENVIERAVVLGNTDYIVKEDLPSHILDLGAACTPRSRFYDVMHSTKKQLVQEALDQSDGDYRGAARLLGLHPSYVHRLIHSLHIPARVTREK